MNTKILLAALLAATPIAAADAMNVAIFLQKAEALEKKGMMALFSGDFKVLKKEVEGASGQLRTERLTAQKTGRKPAFCPPAKGGSLNPNELLAHMRSIPAAQRSQTEVKDGLRGLLARKYPCPG